MSSSKIWVIDQIIDGKRESTLHTQEAVDLALNRAKEKGDTPCPRIQISPSAESR